MKPLGVFLLLVAGLLAYVVGRMDGAPSDDPALEVQTTNALHAGAAWRKRDSVLRRELGVYRAIQEREDVGFRSDTAAARELRRQQEILAATLPALFDTRDSLRVFKDLYRLSEEERGRLRAGIDRAIRQLESVRAERDRWKTLADEARPVIDSLMLALVNQSHARRCYLVNVFGLRVACPSRKLVALVAIGGTLVAERFLVHP